MYPNRGLNFQIAITRNPIKFGFENNCATRKSQEMYQINLNSRSSVVLNWPHYVNIFPCRLWRFYLQGFHNSVTLFQFLESLAVNLFSAASEQSRRATVWTSGGWPCATSSGCPSDAHEFVPFIRRTGDNNWIVPSASHRGDISWKLRMIIHPVHLSAQLGNWSMVAEGDCPLGFPKNWERVAKIWYPCERKAAKSVAKVSI